MDNSVTIPAWKILLDEVLKKKRDLQYSNTLMDISASDKLSVLLAAGKAFISAFHDYNERADKFYVCISVKPLFGLSEEKDSYIPVSNEELHSAFGFFVLDNEFGIDVWACQTYNTMPCPDKLSEFTKAGWILEKRENQNGTSLNFLKAKGSVI